MKNSSSDDSRANAVCFCCGCQSQRRTVSPYGLGIFYLPILPLPTSPSVPEKDYVPGIFTPFYPSLYPTPNTSSRM